MIIAVDFDGTCVTHEFPEVGEDIGAAEILKELVDKGHKLILYTMRSNRPEAGPTYDVNIQDVTGMFLDAAVTWFAENDIPLYAVQTNPTQSNWTSSPKCYAEMYIDDAALGCPLKFDEKSARPYVDWDWVRRILVAKGLL